MKNLLDGNFKGKVYAVNPKATEIQGITCYSNAEDLPPVDCAILALAAKYCPATVKILADNMIQEDLLFYLPALAKKTKKVPP